MHYEMWHPLSARESNSQKLRDGVAAGLEMPLRAWIDQQVRKHGIVERVSVRCDITRDPEYADEPDGAEYLAYCTHSDELLDIVDATLDLMPSATQLPAALPQKNSVEAISAISAYMYAAPARLARKELQKLLDDARSIFTIRADGKGLARRVDPTVALAAETAIEHADKPGRGSAARHLRLAWDFAHAIKPDPVRAYSEAIKAVEAAAHLTLQPKHSKATLGTMIGELPQIKHKLRVPIGGTDGIDGIQTVTSMMKLLWSGQTSRHGNLQETRDETISEAIMAVSMAAILVYLFSSGMIRRL